MTTSRADLHRLVDELSDDEVEPAARALRILGSPVLRALRDAPEDDEELTPEEREAIEEGREAARRGDVVSSEELIRELGL